MWFKHLVFSFSLVKIFLTVTLIKDGKWVMDSHLLYCEHVKSKHFMPKEEVKSVELKTSWIFEWWTWQTTYTLAEMLQGWRKLYKTNYIIIDYSYIFVSFNYISFLHFFETKLFTPSFYSERNTVITQYRKSYWTERFRINGSEDRWQATLRDGQKTVCGGVPSVEKNKVNKRFL